jgi:hypothetical protein
MSDADANGDGRLTADQVEALIRTELAEVKIEQGKFKLREWEDLEDAADKAVTPWIGVNFPPLWFIRGEFWLYLRRKEPRLAYEDLAELESDVLLSAINRTQREGSDEDPTPPAAKPERRASPASATSGE